MQITLSFLSEFETMKLVSSADFKAYIFNHPKFITFEKIIGHSFKHKELLLNALIHRSFVNEFEKLYEKNNEKLEFLGDSILGAIIASKIYHEFTGLKEGQLSKLRSSLVNEDSLFDLGKAIEIPSIVILGKGEFKNNGFNKPSIVSDAFEAILGAIYLDGGMGAAQKFVESSFEIYKSVTGNGFLSQERISNFDSKTKLQEITTKLYKCLPKYLAERNEEDGSFTVELIINEKSILKLTDISKKKAERELARIALRDHLY